MRKTNVFWMVSNIGTRAHMVKLEDSKAAPKKCSISTWLKFLKKSSSSSSIVSC